MAAEHELLVGLSEDELEALAEAKLAPAAQSRLDDLLERNSRGALKLEEESELDRLLRQVDQLTLLKTRARFTRAQHAAAGGA